MPYSIGERGSYGCDGYPVVKDSDKEVMGCHDTREAAVNQIAAIEANEAEKLGIKEPEPWPGTRKEHGGDMPMSGKIKEGDFVMGETTEGLVHGVVEHIMWEGGVLGTPGSEYALQSMPPENPAMSVRIYEQDMEEKWVPTAYSIGMMYKEASVHDINDHDMGEADDMEEMEYVAKKSPCWKGYRQEGMKPGRNGGMVPNCVPVKKWLEAMEKAESYSPNDGMKSAARRALQWKKDGKAKGAGTAVGWGRASDIVAGRSMSLSVVKRMYSFFSRHEVDKKAKGFNSGEEGYPSKGRVMWDAWGGDAGFSWSRKIVERNKNKMLFEDMFGRDAMLETVRNSGREVVKAESVRVGQMVSWNSSGGRATGKVKRIITSGSYDVPGTDVTINASEENPAVVITLYRDGEATDTIVAHRMSTLRAA